MTEQIDNGLLIRPDCAGVSLNFTLKFNWNGHMQCDVMNFEITPHSRQFLGQAFIAMSQILLSDAPIQ